MSRKLLDEHFLAQGAAPVQAAHGSAGLFATVLAKIRVLTLSRVRPLAPGACLPELAARVEAAIVSGIGARRPIAALVGIGAFVGRLPVPDDAAIEPRATPVDAALATAWLRAVVPAFVAVGAVGAELPASKGAVLRIGAAQVEAARDVALLSVTVAALLRSWQKLVDHCPL